MFYLMPLYLNTALSKLFKIKIIKCVYSWMDYKFLMGIDSQQSI